MPHIYRMDEMTTQGILLSETEAEEFAYFKKQKKIAEAHSALSRAVIEEKTEVLADLKKGVEKGKKIGASSIKTTSLYLSFLREYCLSSGLKIDCVIGRGDVATKVKVAETKYAIRNGASEITLCLSPFLLKNGRMGEIKREIRKVIKVSKKRPVKIALPYFGEESVVKIASMISENGGRFISLPYYDGVERIKEGIGAKCMMEVTNVEDPTDYKSLVLAGVERISLSCGEEVYDLLMAEAEESAKHNVVKEWYITPTIESRSPYQKEHIEKDDGIE